MDGQGFASNELYLVNALPANIKKKSFFHEIKCTKWQVSWNSDIHWWSGQSADPFHVCSWLLYIVIGTVLLTILPVKIDVFDFQNEWPLNKLVCPPDKI